MTRLDSGLILCGLNKFKSRLSQSIGESEVISGSDFVPISATGGTVTDVTIDGRLYRVHDFTSSDDFVVTDLGSEGGAARALAVGAGASGAHSRNDGAGCGAGGEVIEQDVTLTIGTHAIVIGAGGAAVTGSNTNGNSGSNTTGLGLDANGGGYGGAYNTAGGNAVNGGGAGSGAGTGLNPPGGTGTRNGGNGYGNASSPNRAAGGSAGAATAGGNASIKTGGTGGDGKESSIDGISRYYGAGVSGYAYTQGGGIIPPAPLGGVQGVTWLATPNAGTDGLGNGGGAYSGGSDAVLSGKGASGRFIVRYPLEAA